MFSFLHDFSSISVCVCVCVKEGHKKLGRGKVERKMEDIE